MLRIVLTAFLIASWVLTRAQANPTGGDPPYPETNRYSVGINILTSELTPYAYYPLIQLYAPVSVVVKKTGSPLSQRASFTYFKEDLRFISHSFHGYRGGRRTSNNFLLKAGIEHHHKLWKKIQWYPAVDAALVHVNGVSRNYYNSWLSKGDWERTYALWGVGIGASVGLIFNLSDRLNLQFETGGVLYVYYMDAITEMETSRFAGDSREVSSGPGMSGFVSPVQMLAIHYTIGY